MEVEGMDSEALRAVFMRIDNFSGEYDFLHPDFTCPVRFRGLEFRSVSHGLRFLRFVHSLDGDRYHYDNGVDPPPRVREYVARLDDSAAPAESDENPSWSGNRHQWVELLLRDKYRRNLDIRTKLAATGDRSLLFVSDDHFLGSDGKSGQNKIGRLTELIRQDIADYKDHRVWLFMCQNMSGEDFWVSLDEVQGEGHVQRHRYEGKCCYDIGRIPSCDLRPANPSISRVHASVCMSRQGRVCVVNYNAATGLCVNGKQLEPHEPLALRSGDSILIGASRRVYRVAIDEDLVEQKLEQMHHKRRELRRQADVKAQRINNELETFLKGSNEVVVLNVSYKTKRAALYDFFAACGDIESVHLPQERGMIDDPASDDTLASRGVAFIKFRDKKSASNALERDGMYLNYRKVQVQYRTRQGWGSAPQRQNARSRSRSAPRSRASRMRHSRSGSRVRRSARSSSDSRHGRRRSRSHRRYSSDS